MNTVTLKWVTPNVEQMIIDCARVSSTKPEGSEGAGLLRYCSRNGHWSVFEMASMCLEVTTTRDVARQLLRHRSLSFQEFSQRYAGVHEWVEPRPARMQHPTNRQASLPCDDPELQEWWEEAQREVMDYVGEMYRYALSQGIAKEVARAVLPEGLTPSRLFLTGTIRSWIHFIQVRDADGVQPECRDVARKVRAIFTEQCPVIAEAVL